MDSLEKLDKKGIYIGDEARIFTQSTEWGDNMNSSAKVADPSSKSPTPTFYNHSKKKTQTPRSSH
jgi:hypothetical protein